MKFTLYHADCLEIPGNCTYPHKVEVTGKDSLIDAVKHDYVCAEYQGNSRCGAMGMYPASTAKRL